MDWEQGHIVVQEGMLSRNGKEIATFSSAEFRPSINVREWLWGGCLQISKLKIRQNSIPLTATSHDKVRQGRFFFQPDISLHVLDAVMVPQNEQRPIRFDFILQKKRKDVLGHVALYEAQRPTEILFSVQDHHQQVTAQFHDLSLCSFQTACDLFLSSGQAKALLDWQIQEGSIEGYFNADFEQGVLKNCRSNICIKEFQARYQEGLIAQQIPVCHLQVEVEKGVLTQVELDGNIFGVQTDISLNWLHDSELMHLHCEGSLDQSLSFFPAFLQDGLRHTFVGQTLCLTTQLVKHHHGLELEGVLTDADQHRLEFGCQFPFLTDTSVSCSLVDSLKQQFCLYEGFLGWFMAKELPVETFLKPYLLGEAQVQFCGYLNVEGSFNERYLAMFYQGHDVNFETASLRLDIPVIKESGVHYVDFVTAEHVGYLPIQGACYEQKNCQFVMEDVTSVLHIENTSFSFQNIANLWNGLPLSGCVDIEINSLYDMIVEIAFACNQGSLLAGQQLLHHFVHTALDQLPMQGTFSLDPLETSFIFHFTPQMEILKGRVKGSTCFQLDLPIAKFKEGRGAFTYDFGTKSLEFSMLEAQTSVCGRSLCMVSQVCILHPQAWNWQGSLVGLEPYPLHLEAKWDKEICIQAERLSIKGRQEGEHYYFDHLIWQDYQGSAVLYADEKNYSLEQLILAHPKMGRCEICGTWDRSIQEAQGKIILEALDLAQILPSKTGPWGIMGTFSGKGTLKWNAHQGLCAMMQGEHRNLEFGSLQFGNSDELIVSYDSKEGFCLEGLEALGLYRLGALHYDPNAQRAYFDGFDFVLTNDKLPWLTEVASTLFSGKIYPSTLDFLSQLKQEGPLCGRLWIDLAPQNLRVHLKMQDGEYYFGQQVWNLKDFSLVYDPQDIHVKTGLRLGQIDSCIHWTANSQYLSRGTLVIQQEQAEDILTATWHQDPTFGYVIDNIQGSFAGVTCSLSHFSPSEHSFDFEGNISCQPQTTVSLFPFDVQQWIHNYQLAGSLCLKGQFSFPKHDLLHPHFKGELVGTDVAFSTVVIALLTSQCEINPNRIELRNIAIRDWSGDLFCDQLRLLKKDRWLIEADHIALHDFRLSRLDSSWTKRERGSRPVFRSLFINTCEMHHVKGFLSDKYSLSAEGQVQFTHTPRRTLFSNLMMIPAEITARIGLDLTALIPAKGTIQYKIAEGKIHFLDFQDVYSDSKRSRFYLVENQPSYINLDGELNLCIRMKQYNLLMKLAELFTFTVKGTIKSPQYTFTSQNLNEPL
ncbi:MAG: hypothetical protein JSS62_00620 [Verrucomicrobia bacterium]|nr:hypothetical protein [Verrucomicrobiota bacterium]